MKENKFTDLFVVDFQLRQEACHLDAGISTSKCQNKKTIAIVVNDHGQQAPLKGQRDICISMPTHANEV